MKDKMAGGALLIIILMDYLPQLFIFGLFTTTIYFYNLRYYIYVLN